MIIDCISDLHGFQPQLPGGDLLIVAGDLTTSDTERNYEEFENWIGKQKYKKCIIIAGNHDNNLESYIYHRGTDCTYLQDTGTEFEGLKIWGSPWSLAFDGINPKYKAFTKKSDKSLSEKWELIPTDIDILITHIPPNGLLDRINNFFHEDDGDSHVGSTSLRNYVISDRFPNLKLHVFGHIHEWGGQQVKMPLTTFVNASYVNEVYEPVNMPIRIDL